MTDHRVSDLPYGQIGDCTYDVDQQKWSFSRKISYNYGIQPVDSPKQCLPPTLPRGTFTPTPSHAVQKNILTKRFPELIPANFITKELEKSAPNDEKSIKESLSTSSTLIAFGKARDSDNRRGAIIDIVALASGKAGEVLRIIRPQLDKLEWFGHEGGIHIEALNPSTALEECYWVGNGGAIRQITFAMEENGQSKWLASSSSWLAVRQTNCTTIFKPLYRREPTAAIVPQRTSFKYPSSRLTSNPIASIPMGDTGDIPHADVTFNPFYARQVAILDQGGSWSIWDMEGKEAKSTFKMTRGKHGHILDDLEPDARSSRPDADDGWGRILWAGDVNTLIVCSRVHLAAFNIQGETSRLPIPDVFTSMSSGWILDVKQNACQLNHVFVLTSTRIFWLEITSDDEDTGEVRILFSCRHFRDEDGENMKLDVLSEESSCTLLLYSGANVLINTYQLSTVQNQNGMPECMDSSFACKNTTATNVNMKPVRTHSIATISSPYFGTDDRSPGSKYQNHGILFYQLFSLSMDLELIVTLCSTTFALNKKSSTGAVKYEDITAPLVRDVKRNTRQARFAVDANPFIAPDDFDSDSDREVSDEGGLGQFRGYRPPKKPGQSRPYALNFHPVFEQLFQNVGSNDEESPGAVSENITEFVQALPQRVNDWKAEQQNSLTTLIDFAGSLSFSGDIDEIAAAMSNMMRSLPEDIENESEKILTVSQITGTDLSLLAKGKGVDLPLDLITVYNHLIDIWVTCLPRRTPGSIRLLRERIIRKVAADLALSSVAISMGLPPIQKPDVIIDFDEMDIDRGTPFSSSQPEPIGGESSQRRARSVSLSTDPGLPTPEYTASVVSERYTQTEAGEDPVISLLRKYADFPPQPPLGPTVSRILSHWVPGADPDQYSWEAARRAHATAEYEDEDNAYSRRRKIRRKKKAEKSSRYKRAGTVESGISQATSISQSQPSFPAAHFRPGPSFGSQPAFAQGTMPSSQVTGGMDLPMTQVEDGQFGGRQVFRKKKTKKRKQGF